MNETNALGLENNTSIESEEITPEQIHEQPIRTPLPKFQLFIVFLIQFSEPVTASVIYPFINQFIRETGVTKGDERKTGYYAGIIESVFFFAEALTVFQWGWASDRVGRRPILLLGPFGLSIAMISFGLSNNFWTLMVSRCMQGAFNGNLGVSKSVIAEITDASNIADAFAMVPLMWSFGSTIGPILGGVLSRPAIRWPDTFGKILFFHKYPYFLPCAAASLLAFISGAIAFLGLKETLPSAILRKESKRLRSNLKANPDPSTSLLEHNNDSDYGTTSSNPDHPTIEAGTVTAPQDPAPISALFTRQFIVTLITYASLAFIDMSSQVLHPLVYSTSIPLGGFDLDPYEIGVIMGIWGVVNAVVQIFFMAWFIRKFGPRTTQIVSQSGYAVVLGLYPVLSFLVRRSGAVDTTVWTVLVIQLIIRLTNYMAWGAISILLVDNAPNRASLGATNGIAHALGSIVRSFAPSVASSLYSLSLQKNLMGGNMVYVVLICISFVGIRAAFMLPKHLKSDKR